MSELAFESAQTREFGGEHVVCGCHSGFFAGDIRLGDWSRAVQEILPGRAGGCEAGQERHECDTNDTDTLQAGFAK